MRFLPPTFAALLLTACAVAPEYSEDEEYYADAEAEGEADYEPEYEPTAESLDYPAMPGMAAPIGETAATIDLTSPDGGGDLEPVVFAPIAAAPKVTTIAPPTRPQTPPQAVVFEQPQQIEATWIDVFGRRWQVAFVCTFNSDDQHDHLARACFAASAIAASEVATTVCRQFDLDRFAGIEACENELASQLTRMMHQNGLTAQTRVHGVRWTHWRAD